MVSTVFYPEEEESCEIIKGVSEEEDGEDTERFFDSEFLKANYSDSDQVLTPDDISEGNYPSRNLSFILISLEVQTPPPRS